MEKPPGRNAASLIGALCAAVAIAALAGCGGGSASQQVTTATATVPAAGRPAALASVRHVFVIVLENEDAATTFGPDSPAPYLAGTLRRRGVFVPGYYGISHHSLTDYVALVSGQGPNGATQLDCPVFSDVRPGTGGAGGQARGVGCVYPRSVETVADQLEARHLTWKGYMEDMGDDPARDGGRTCAHPAIGARDRAQAATAADQYATRHNPFVYFHAIIDRHADCAARDVALTRLPGDLARASRTAHLSFISPDLCHDGHDATCADGGPGGLPAADAFLRAWVPRITSSPAFRRDGLLVVTFDEAADDSTACCGARGGGGGRVGAVVLSPLARAGTETQHAYNHYSLLRTIEDIFGLAHLGHAGDAGTTPFGADVLGRAG